MSKQPVFDGEDSLDELIQWTSEPIDIKERAERMRLGAEKAKGFGVFLMQYFNKVLPFDVTLSQGPMEIRTKKLGRWGYVPFHKLMNELHRYSDKSSLLPQYRLNQLISALDDVYGPDSKHIVGMLEGNNTLPDKFNDKVFHLAFPEVLSGEGNGQSPESESQ